MKKLKKYQKRLFAGTITIIFGTGFMAVFFFYLFSIFGFLFQLGVVIIFGAIAVIAELLLLSHIDTIKQIEIKSRFIELGLMPEERTTEEEIKREKQIILSKIEQQNIKQMTRLQNFRHFLKLHVAELGELTLEIDDLFRECKLLIEQGRMKKAKREFNQKYQDIRNRIAEMKNEFDSRINKHFDLTKYHSQKVKTFIFSFKEEWARECSKLEKILIETVNKFEQKTNLPQYIEDIFQFEIENERQFTEDDFFRLKIPRDQIKILLNMIDKPVKVNLSEISQEKKKILASVGKKVIAHFSILDKTPTLPDLYVNLGISLTDAKEVLSYLKSIGMIDKIYYHVV
ncbi:MAG: hypothetical protein ACTSSI_12325 [Candidatus Helarchaeota archaeon]